MNSVGCWQEVMGGQRPEVAAGFCHKEALISVAVLHGGEGTGARSPGVEFELDLFILCCVPSFSDTWHTASAKKTLVK